MKYTKKERNSNMYLRILKKDLKRKKTMNIILLMFIILASTFMAVSANNILTVISGTDYYLGQRISLSNFR